jgi:hypothetical protein
MDQHGRDVCFVPKADIVRCGEIRPLFDHFVGEEEKVAKYRQAEQPS